METKSGTPSVADAAPSADRETAYQLISPAGIAILVLGVLNLVDAFGIQLLPDILVRPLPTSERLSLIAGILLIVGGSMMLSLRSRAVAVLSCVMAIIPVHPAAVPGIAVGIWGLLRLSDPRVAKAFGSTYTTPSRTPADRPRSSLLNATIGCLVAAVLLVVLLSFAATILGIFLPAFSRARNAASRAAGHDTQTTNLVRNPGFDDDLAQRWPPGHWEISPLDGGSTVTYDTVKFRGGVASLRLSRDASSTQPRIWVRQVVPGVEGFRQIHVSFTGSTAELRDGHARASIEFETERGGTTTRDISSVTSTNEWYTQDQDILVPESTKKVTLYLENSGHGDAWFDNLTVVGTDASRR